MLPPHRFHPKRVLLQAHTQMLSPDRFHRKQVLPGLEPGLQGSKPWVLTNYTIEPLCIHRHSAVTSTLLDSTCLRTWYNKDLFYLLTESGTFFKQQRWREGSASLGVTDQLVATSGVTHELVAILRGCAQSARAQPGVQAIASVLPLGRFHHKQMLPLPAKTGSTGT